jgi:hypothetical protein
VRRLRPTARVSGRKSSLSHWEAGAEARVAYCSSGVRQSRSGSHPLSPPEFPRALSAGEIGGRAPKSPPKRPKRRPDREVLPLKASPTGRYPRWLLKSLANRQ